MALAPGSDAPEFKEPTSAALSYAGIGSRRTPREVLDSMRALAARLARRGLVLRSGISPGADQAFYGGALEARGRIELYLPCPGFQAGAWSDADPQTVSVLARPSEAAFELAARFHPQWERLSPAERRLRARDAHVILGADLERPVRFVVCWTAAGDLDGSGPLTEGTGQALRIARGCGIPAFNLADPDHARRMRELCAL
jgi:hypothetical protein